MRRRGVALLETIFASGLLAAAIGSLLVAQVRARAVVNDSADQRRAVSAAVDKLDEVRTVELADVCARYGPGSPGRDFAVALPEGEGTVVVHPDETEVNATLGLPRDLDGDGSAANPDVSAAPRLLPVEVIVRWRGASGVRSFKVATLLAKKL